MLGCSAMTIRAVVSSIGHLNYFNLTAANLFISFAIKFERFRFSASAILSISTIRALGNEMEICVIPKARADLLAFLDLFGMVYQK